MHSVVGCKCACKWKTSVTTFLKKKNCSFLQKTVQYSKTVLCKSSFRWASNTSRKLASGQECDRAEGSIWSDMHGLVTHILDVNVTQTKSHKFDFKEKSRIALHRLLLLRLKPAQKKMDGEFWACRRLQFDKTETRVQSFCEQMLPFFNLDNQKYLDSRSFYPDAWYGLLWDSSPSYCDNWCYLMKPWSQFNFFSVFNSLINII